MGIFKQLRAQMLIQVSSIAKRQQLPVIFVFRGTVKIDDYPGFQSNLCIAEIPNRYYNKIKRLNRTAFVHLP